MLVQLKVTSDDGVQNLYRAAPNLIVPVLRPYRRWGEIDNWFCDEAIIAHVQSRAGDRDSLNHRVSPSNERLLAFAY